MEYKLKIRGEDMLISIKKKTIRRPGTSEVRKLTLEQIDWFKESIQTLYGMTVK